jgi:predicted double-glycine peptidase
MRRREIDTSRRTFHAPHTERGLLVRAAMQPRPLAFLFTVLALSCASSPQESASAESSEAATGVLVPDSIVRVPLVRQATDYSCGDASALALLRYWRWDDYASVGEEALYAPLGTTEKDGTDPQPIAAYLNGVAGVSADYRHDASVDELYAAVDRGEPPIVDLQAWQSTARDWDTDWDDGHYVVLVGYDAQRLYFMDPSTPHKYAYIPLAQFESRWHDTVGKHNAHAQHMAIFVHADAPTAPSVSLPPRATRID